ncbi:MAG: hypothetical protein R2762_00175 [Bryobacteraceae bacterium]
MNLINHTGDEIEMSAAEWSEIRQLAVLHGWTPQGTSAPPLDFDARRTGRWSGSYDAPTGQMVRREDAARLADAIELARRPHHHRLLSEGAVGRVIRFLRSGPFLLTGSPVPEPPPPALPLDHQLISLSAALEQSVRIEAPMPSDSVTSDRK